MSQSNEANDYKILSVETDKKFPENSNIIKFDKNNKVLEKPQRKTFNEITYSFLKRTVDITASATALLLLSPVFLVTSLAIKNDSKGPAMFTQKRIGKDGKLFEIYKFRTMVPEADEILFELLKNNPELAKEYKKDDVMQFDTHGGIKFMIKMPFVLIRALKRCQNIIIMPAHKGICVITPFLLFFNIFFNRPIHYVVIGGWLSDMLASKKWLLYLVKKFKYIYIL